MSFITLDEKGNQIYSDKEFCDNPYKSVGYSKEMFDFLSLLDADTIKKIKELLDVLDVGKLKKMMDLINV